MATIAIRQSAVQSMTVRQRRLTRWVLAEVGIVDPARFTAPGGNVWLVFDDHRIDLRDVAYFGCFAAQVANLPNDYDPPDQLDDATSAEARAWVRSKLNQLVVWPVPNIENAADPWQAALDAQSAPAVVRAGTGVPSTWTPVTA